MGLNAFSLRNLFCSLIFPCFFCLTMQAQGRSQACMFHQTFIEMDMDKWKSETEALEVAYLRTENPLLLLDLLKAQYGYLGYLMGEGERTDDAKDWLSRFERYVNDLFATQSNDALAYCYQASMYAYRIVLSPATAIVNGRRCMNAIEKSMELAPDSYIVWSNRAIIETNIPSLVGADYKKAITYYQKALALMEEQETERCNWILLNTLVWKAKCYEKLADPDMAKQTYAGILKIAPDFESVKRWKERL